MMKKVISVERQLMSVFNQVRALNTKRPTKDGELRCRCLGLIKVLEQLQSPQLKEGRGIVGVFSTVFKVDSVLREESSTVYRASGLGRDRGHEFVAKYAEFATSFLLQRAIAGLIPPRGIKGQKSPYILYPKDWVLMTSDKGSVGVLALYEKGSCDVLDVVNTLRGFQLQELNSMALKSGFDSFHDVLLYMVKSMAIGVGAVHEKQIHRDVKLSNFLVMMNGQIKLGDFDFSLPGMMGGKSLGFYGSPGKIAPERFETKWVDRSIDIWSFGMLLLRVLAGIELGRFSGIAYTQYEVFKKVTSIDFSSIKNRLGLVRYIPQDRIDLCLDLIQKMLRFGKDQKNRIDIKAVLQHPYIKEVKVTSGHRDRFARFVRCLVDAKPSKMRSSTSKWASGSATSLPKYMLARVKSVCGEFFRSKLIRLFIAAMLVLKLSQSRWVRAWWRCFVKKWWNRARLR